MNTSPADAPRPVSDDVAAALRSRRGLVDSGVPGAVFVLAYTVGGFWWADDALPVAVWAAVASAVGLVAVRLVRRESVQQTLFGLVGVAVGAVLAARSGQAQDFYLPGLFIQAGYGLVYLASILIGWPLVGVVVGPLVGEGMAWRFDPRRRGAYSRATWLWVAMFALRLAVRVPLYLAGAVVALGVTSLVMGWPLFVLVAWLTYALLRGVPVGRPVPDSPPS